MTVKFEKSQYPVDTEGRYQGWAIVDGEFIEGIITGNIFRHLPTFGEAVEIDITDAEESNVRDQWDALNSHDQKMQDWFDQE